jgi:antitoxin (DNA-binding transcriptional repressor) of toxin-antitoxin stability system
MKALTIGEFKSRFSELLELIKKGEKIEILYGKSRKPIAMLVPIDEYHEKRKLGIWEGKAVFSQKGNGKISEDEFLGIK